MKIQEFESLSGLDRATVRFYEREGLLSPSRTENGYRDYSQQDVDEIRKIALLRRLDLSLETIKDLQQGRAQLSEVLLQQILVLKKRTATTQRALEICQFIQSSQATYETLDSAAFQSFEGSEQPLLWQQPPYHDPKAIVPYHPVRRFIARMIDYFLVGLLLKIIFVVILRIRPFTDTIWHYLTLYSAPLLAVPIYGFFLSYTGTTPGKWLMGISVYDNGKQKLSCRNAMRREWNVLRYGYGFGIPFYRLWRLFQSYKNYSIYKDVTWRESSFCRYSDFKLRKKAVFAGFLALSITVSWLIAQDAAMPKYRRNDVTIEQFAENYNFYMAMYEINNRMYDDGTWEHDTPQTLTFMDDGNYTGDGNYPEKLYETFCIETEDGYITRITYQNTWTAVNCFNPMFCDDFFYICLVTLGTQQGVDLADISQFTQEFNAQIQTGFGNIICENVEVVWSTQNVNCKRSSSGYYTRNNSIVPNSISLNFEIIIH